MKPDLLTLSDLSPDALRLILALAETAAPPRILSGCGVALVFQKPSARTRNSMEMAVAQLGGHPVYIKDEEVGLGVRETPQDAARTLACYHACIAARVFDHSALDAMAAAVDTPVLNLLSGESHPLQALADLLTMRQLAGGFEDVRLAYVGDVNNVSRSLAEGCALLGVPMSVGAPEGHQFSAGEIDRLNALGGDLRQYADPAEAAAGANFIYTDVWTSMGQSDPDGARRHTLEPYRVDASLMARGRDAWFLHCLPAHRGEEVSAGVIDGPRSAVWRQAENRMHSARGALCWIFGEDHG